MSLSSLRTVLCRTHIRRLSTVSASRLSRTATKTPKSSKEDKAELFGTVPVHFSYILLHTSEPPTSYPSQFTTPVQRALQAEVMEWGGTVNFVWYGSSEPREENSITAFSTLGGRLELPSVNLDNVQNVAKKLENHVYGPLVPQTMDEIHIYVCTHGNRDCRCGDTGREVVDALHKEVARLQKNDPSGPASRIKIGEVAHVGGHQYAANMLIYPHGEWLGMLTAADVPMALYKILKTHVMPFQRLMKPIVLKQWRGRMGLSKGDQIKLYRHYAKK